MRLLKQALALLGALVVLSVIVAFVAPKKAHALAAALVQLVPGTTTHVGQNEGQLVSLFCNETACYPIDSSGNLAPSPQTVYVVPSGYTLIVTDWEWFSTEVPSGFAGDSLFNASTNGGFVSSLVTASTPHLAFTHEHYVTGIRVASGIEIHDLVAIQGFGNANIQGYLVPN